MATLARKQPLSPVQESPLSLEGKGGYGESACRRNNELVLAAGRGDYAIVKQMIAEGADIDARCPPPLGIFNNGIGEVVEDKDPHWLLISCWLEGSIQVDRVNIGRTALQAAADGGHEDVVVLLLNSGADVNAPSAQVFGRTALQAAAGSGHIGVLGLLINNGASINAPPAAQYGRTALQAAAETGYEEVVTLLIEGQAVIDTPAGKHFGRTALQAAAGGGWEGVVKMLIDCGSDVNAQPAAIGGRTALQAAAEDGHIETVKTLINSRADVNASPAVRYGTTALEGAAAGGHESVLKELFKAGAMEGSTCTILHESVDDPARLEMLIRLHKFDVNAKDYLGLTPLHVAAKRSSVPAVTILMNDLADPDIADISGRTPLKTALEKGCGEILDILLRHGARTDGLIVDGYLSLPRSNPLPDNGCAVILREESSRHRAIEQSTWSDTEIKNLKDTRWTLPSICLFNSSSGYELFEDTVSFADPDVYLKAYHNHEHSPEETVARWSWLTMRKYRDDFSSHHTPFQDGIPSSEGMSSKPDAEVILVGYVKFTVPASSPDIGTKMKTFDTQPRKIEISWIMRESDRAPESSMESHLQFGAINKLRDSVFRTGTSNSLTGPLKRSGTYNSTNGTFDRNRGSILRSANFRGTLRVKYLRIPHNGVEFFILFLDYIHENWLEIIQNARVHLAMIRGEQLKSGGKDAGIIGCLLEDSQEWNTLRAQLDTHIAKAVEVLNTFQKNEALYMELVDPDDWRETTGHLPVIVTLKNNIMNFEKDCKNKIKHLAEETKEMIELEFSLVSIAEARRSIEMSMSMKRLSWITFIFLPLTFCSGLFGMNVNIFRSNPSWLWYPVVAIPVLLLILVVWLLFKYIPVGAWVEKHIGKWLDDRIGKPLQERISERSRIRKEKLAQLVKGQERPSTSGSRQSFPESTPVKRILRKPKTLHRDLESNGVNL